VPDSDLIALDVAILPPPDVTARAVALSYSLPDDDSQDLRLDQQHLPHVTLTQQFVRANELEEAFSHIDGVLKTQPPLTMHVTGAGESGSTVWMAIERTTAIVDLHHRLMDALRGLERPDGGRAAFADQGARVGDVLWVASFRLKASFGAYTPHITLGHASAHPAIQPFAFEARTVAACHLGRFCTCRRVLHEWQLKTEIPNSKSQIPMKSQ